MSTSRIGIVAKLESGPEQLAEKLAAVGVPVCHLSAYDPAYMTDAIRDRLAEDLKARGIEVAALWSGWPGHVVWDFVEGPATTGLVPPQLRAERAELLKRGAEFAASLGASMVMTHIGFVPEDMHDENYTSLIPVLRDLARHCEGLGLSFCFETGQETPITLLRTIEDVGMANVGVNFDPANLLLYGKANPVDAVATLAPHIRSVHAKDGHYPVNGRDLGREVQLGDGRVDFPKLIAALRAAGYDGDYFIETEEYGPGRHALLVEAKRRLDGWLAAG